MLLYATKVAVAKEFDENNFIRNAVLWNEGSPHDRLSNLHWDGTSKNLSAKKENMSITISDIPSESIIACHFTKLDEKGIMWTTDFILDYSNHILAVQLYRETTSRALFIPSFAKPYFVKQIINKNFGGLDIDLKVSCEPLEINQDNIKVIKNLILEESTYSMPVVYITKTWAEKTKLNVGSLAYALQGDAHILVDQNHEIGKLLMSQVNGKNPHNGGIGVYFPNRYVNIFLSNNYDSEEILEKKIVNFVHNYLKQQKIESKFMWSGLKNIILKKKNIQLLTEKNKVKEEVDEAIEIFGEALKEQEENAAELLKKIEMLTAENLGLREKFNQSEGLPVLYFGEEENFYEGEIREVVFESLEAMKEKLPENTRRRHIIEDLLCGNQKTEVIKARKERIKKVLRNYKSLDPTTRRELQQLGFSISEEGKHYKITYYNDNRYTATMSKTGSDYRGGMNLASHIINRFL